MKGIDVSYYYEGYSEFKTGNFRLRQNPLHGQAQPPLPELVEENTKELRP